MKSLRKFIADFFHFTPVEVRGFFILLLLLLFFTFLPFIWTYFLPKTSYDSTADKALLDSLLASMEKVEEKQTLPKKQKSFPQKTLFTFDPNTATKKQLLDLGIRDYLAVRIIKYRTKVNSFSQPEDLLKIYGFSEPLYKKLQPYIRIKSISKKEKSEEVFVDKDGNENLENLTETVELVKSEREFVKPTKFSLNAADTTQLKKVYGIGSKLASRIVKFRDKLGGFHDTKQLTEVYGLKQETIGKLLEKAEIIDPTEIKKIFINQLDEKDLQQHPYISWKEAKFIIKYRKQHGPYKSIAGVADIKVFNKAFIKKIEPYLSFD